MTKRKLLASCIAAVAAVSPGVTAAQESGFILEEIIVTAQKRGQNLQDVDLSVTALDAVAMERAGIRDISRLELVTPGFSYGFIGSDSKIAIRGANSNNTYGDNSSIAGFFVDGVYRPRAAQQSQGYFDVERIEVLKGPQGTLYGRNTFAGAVNLYTNRPSTEALDGGIKTSFESFGRTINDAFINVPMGDDFAVRVALNTRDSDGYIDNNGAGSDLGQEDGFNYRVSALWTPTEDVEVLLRYTSIDDTGTGPGVFAAEGICQPVNANGITDAVGALDSCAPPRPGADPNGFFDDEYEVSYDIDQNRDYQEENLTLDVSWSINDDLTLRYIASNTDFTQELDGDGDFSNTPGYAYWFDEAADSTTHELTLSSIGDSALSWTAGLYHSVDDIAFGYSEQPFGQFDYFGPFASSYTGYADWQEIEVTTTGIFFQAEYAITDSFRIIAGARDNNEEKDTETFFAPFYLTLDGTDATGPLPGINADGSTDSRTRDLTAYDISPGATANHDFDDTTYRLGVAWDIADNVMVYANASNGFLSGGVNADGTTFDQQDNEAIEIGVKSRWADNTVQLNLALYQNEGTNLTTQTAVLNDQGTFITSTVNGGSIDTTGLEIELDWLPTENWLISANASIMDSEHVEFGARNAFQQFAGVDSGFSSLNGLEPPWAPDATLSVSVGYDIDLGDSGRLTPFVQIFYSSEFNTDDLVTYRAQVQEAYSKTDLRLIWTSASGNISGELFIENLEDNEVLARTNVGGFGTVQSSYAYPRNGGIKLSYNF
jgi:outer membrane receptor protein involved in Fe transport